MSTTQIVQASSAESILAAAAAADAGLLGSPGRRVLVLSRGGPIPETATSPAELPGMAPALARFDQIESLDDLIRPEDARAWSPRGTDRTVFERLLRSGWSLGDDVELVLERDVHQPTEWLASTFYGAPLILLSAGLSAYAPPPEPFSWGVEHRVVRLVHVDRVPGLAPWPFDHTEPDIAAVPDDAWTRVLTETARAAGLMDNPPRPATALVVSENLAGRGLLDRAVETRLLAETIDAVAADGARNVVVLADPGGPVNLRGRLTGVAARDDLSVELIEPAAPHDAYLVALAPQVVGGCFGPLLASAVRAGVRTASTGAKLVKENFRPYPHPDRIVHTIVDALCREDAAWADSDDLARLVECVVFCVYPERFKERRESVVQTVKSLSDADLGRYPTRRRAEALGLIEAPPPPPPTPDPVPAPAPTRQTPLGRISAGIRKAARRNPTGPRAGSTS